VRQKPLKSVVAGKTGHFSSFGTVRANSLSKVRLALLGKYIFRTRIQVLAAAFTVAITTGSACAQSAPPTDSTAAQPTSVQPNPNDSTTYATGQPLSPQSNEGFWGHLNPFARKKWVNRQINPVKDRLNELDQLSAKNGSDIKDVDQRTQAGISQAQTTADQANHQAATANQTAVDAHSLAQQSVSATTRMTTTVATIDQYHPVSDTEIRFRPGQTAINMKAMDALDELSSQVAGQQGYLIEVQGYSRAKGQIGIEASQKLADSVVRYMVEAHQVPVYRIHVLGMGNATLKNSDGVAVNGSVVHVTIVKNSLAALNSTGDSGSSPIGATQQPMSQPSPRSAASSPSAQQQ
jgi:outer membrane protein OmpA-like peptidoglycan-associated protein